MKVGVTIPNHWGVEQPQRVVALGEQAEELGYDSIWTADHLFNAGYIRTRLEDRPYYHPLATLSFLAARTSRIVLGTSVLVLPYHDPIDVAKYAATLDQLSGGRLVLGVGAGGMPEEFQALGIPLRRRGRMTNEAIALMKELWTADYPSFESGRWTFSDVRFSPKPLQKPHVPLWIGGASDAAMTRAATAGNGWHPIGMAHEEFARARGHIREQATALGRDPDDIVMAPRLSVELTPAEAGERRGARLPGAPEEMVISLRAYEAAGADHVVLALDSGDIDLLETTMRRIAQEVLPGLREG